MSHSKKGSNDAVRVMVRVRPFNNNEIAEAGGNPICTLVAQSDTMLTCVSPQQDAAGNPVQVHNFPFDHVLWSMPHEQVPAPGVSFATQLEAYQHVGVPSLESAFEGYNGCIFAYGQTSSGKTHSMMGYVPPPEQRGIIPRLCESLFERIDYAERETQHLEISQGGLRKVVFKVEVSFLEIYNEKVLDLLRKGGHDKPLPIAIDPKHGPVVKGLSVIEVKTWPEVEAVFDKGQLNRSTAATAMNERSSRSHAIVQLIITQEELMGKMGNKFIKKERRSRINLVDLAGSEKVSKSKVEGANLKEAIGINQSLTCLGRVIDHLIDTSSPHIPYRDSVLTHLLSDSLGGNSRTTMLAALSPAAVNYEETLSTLRYASRARKIVNVVKVNEDPAAMLIHELQEELLRMKQDIIAGNIHGLQEQLVNSNDPLLASKPLQQVAAQRAAETEELIAQLQQRDAQDEARLREREKKWEEENEAIQEKHQEEISEMMRQQELLEEERRLLQEQREELENDIKSRRRDNVMAKFSFAAKIAQAKQQQLEAEEQHAHLKRELVLSRWRSSSQKAAESGWKEKAEQLEEELIKARNHIAELEDHLTQIDTQAQGNLQDGSGMGTHGMVRQTSGRFPNEMEYENQEPTPGILAPPCEICLEQPAQFKCSTPPCDNELLCMSCDANQHRNPLTSEHVRTPILAPCECCGIREAVLQCVECGNGVLPALMCQDCDDMKHKNHARKTLVSRACEFCGVRDVAVRCLDCPNGRLCKICDEMKHRNPRREFHRRSFAPLDITNKSLHQNQQSVINQNFEQQNLKQQHVMPLTQIASDREFQKDIHYNSVPQPFGEQIQSGAGFQFASVEPSPLIIPPSVTNHFMYPMPQVQHQPVKSVPTIIPALSVECPRPIMYSQPFYPVVRSPSQNIVQNIAINQPTKVIRY